VAVGDIEKVQRNAYLKRIGLQVLSPFVIYQLQNTVHYLLLTLIFLGDVLFLKAKIQLRGLPRNVPVTHVTGEFQESRRLPCHGIPCHGEVADVDHVSGKSRESFGVSNHLTMATCRVGLKNPRDKSATSPFASF